MSDVRPVRLHRHLPQAKLLDDWANCPSRTAHHAPCARHREGGKSGSTERILGVFQEMLKQY